MYHLWSLWRSAQRDLRKRKGWDPMSPQLLQSLTLSDKKLKVKFDEKCCCKWGESDIFSLLHTVWWPGWRKGAMGHVLSWFNIVYRFEYLSTCFSYTPIHSILWLLLFLRLEIVLNPAALLIYRYYYFKGNARKIRTGSNALDKEKL